MRALSFAALAAAAIAAPLLTPDHPWAVPDGSLQYLSTAHGGAWSVSNPAFNGGAPLAATIPGDLVTDLQAAGAIGDPFYELGFLNTTTPGALGAPVWDVGIWSYSMQFSLSPALAAAVAAGSTPCLVFDGVKMAATVYLNGIALGDVVDQFLRYNFELSASALSPQNNLNNLTIAFGTSRDPRNAEGRFSGASGGWDCA